VFGLKHSLHRGFSDAKQFYFSYTAMVVLAAVIVLIPAPPRADHHRGAGPAGLLLPSASVFLLLLCNDRKCWGPGLIAVAELGRGADRRYSAAAFRDPDGYHHFPAPQRRGGCRLPGAGHGPARCRGGTGAALAGPPPTHGTGRTSPGTRDRPQHWRMPPLALLQPVTWSAGTRLGMIALRAYLVVGALLLVVKAVQLSGG